MGKAAISPSKRKRLSPVLVAAVTTSTGSSITASVSRIRGLDFIQQLDTIFSRSFQFLWGTSAPFAISRFIAVRRKPYGFKLCFHHIFLVSPESGRRAVFLTWRNHLLVLTHRRWLFATCMPRLFDAKKRTPSGIRLTYI